MATAPLSAGQMKELASACVEAIPSDFPSELAQKWIGKKRELGDRLRAILLDSEVSNLPAINWLAVYVELGMEDDYVKAMKNSLVVMENPNLWTMPVIKGITCNKVIGALKKLGVKFYLYVEDLDKDVTTNDRDPNNGSYVVSFLRAVEADEANKNLSANTLKGRGHKGITLLERLLLELGYFLATGKHLDEKNVTLCSGSRRSGGGVPYVCWGSGSREVCVYWCNSVNASDDLRARSVVS